MNHRVRTYTVSGVDHTGTSYRITQPFSAIQAGLAGAVLESDGISIDAAKSLIKEWNRMARAQGNAMTYGIPFVPTDKLAAPKEDSAVKFSWEELCDQQGWNESSQASILEAFVHEKGLIAEFEAFAQERADEENGLAHPRERESESGS